MSDFGPTIQREMSRLLVGDLLGEGIGRRVFTCPLDETLVVKVEEGERSFQNVSEWEIWTWVRGGKRERWFAPCVQISPCGTVLLQRRVDQLRKAERPKTLPAFMNDIKRENFGWLNGRLVCFDYGTMLACVRTLSGASVPAKWKS